MNSLNDSEKVAEEEHLSCAFRPDKKCNETIKPVPVYPNDPLGYKKYVQDDAEEKHGEFQKLDPTASPVKDQFIACSLLESGFCELAGSIPANVAARGPHDEQIPPPLRNARVRDPTTSDAVANPPRDQGLHGPAAPVTDEMEVDSGPNEESAVAGAQGGVGVNAAVAPQDPTCTTAAAGDPPIGRGQATIPYDAAIVPGIVPRAEPSNQKLPHAESDGNHSRVMAMRKITAIVNTIDLYIQINVRAQRSLRGGKAVQDEMTVFTS